MLTDNDLEMISTVHAAGEQLADESITRLIDQAGEANRLRVEVAKLTTRRDELLAAMVKLTRDVPYEEEKNQTAVLIARVGTLRAALKEALDIADYEASEYQGKPQHLVRLPQLRAIAEGKP